MGLLTRQRVSKKLGVSAVKTALAPPFDPADFVARTVAAATARGFTAETFAEIDGCPLVALTRRPTATVAAPAPAIYISAGIHGDEPAAPLALLRLLETDALDERADWFLVPMLNPTGFRRGTRENADGLDLNRDYQDLQTAEVAGHVSWLRRQPRFDLTLCLHEDWESQGFYLYELNPDDRPSLANAMIVAAREHSAIESAAIIDGRPADAPGIIRPTSDPLLRRSWPEAIYLRQHHTTLSYTVETASVQPLETRVATLAAVVRAAVAKLRG